MPYTTEQKTEAVRLYIEHGPDEAARIIGCGRMSIYRWLADTPVPDEKREAQRLETAIRHQLKREALREALLDAAMAGAAAIDLTDPKGFQALSIGVGTFLDKYRLEMGETTARTEHVSIGLIEAEIQKLEAQIGSVPTPANV